MGPRQKLKAQHVHMTQRFRPAHQSLEAFRQTNSQMVPIRTLGIRSLTDQPRGCIRLPVVFPLFALAVIDVEGCRMKFVVKQKRWPGCSLRICVALLTAFLPTWLA